MTRIWSMHMNYYKLLKFSQSPFFLNRLKEEKPEPRSFLDTPSAIPDPDPLDDIKARVLADRIHAGEDYSQVLQGIDPKIVELVKSKL